MLNVNLSSIKKKAIGMLILITVFEGNNIQVLIRTLFYFVTLNYIQVPINK